MSEFEIHNCDFQNEGVRIEKSRSYFHEEFSWQLVLSREATEDDLLNNHCLESVGEEIWSVVSEINNCPFCGEELRNGAINNGKFVLFDSTGCSVDVL